MNPNPMNPMNPQGPQGAPKKSTATIIIVVVIVGGLAALCCIGTLAAIAIPNFIRFQARSKQSEVKTNLKAAYFAEKSYFGEKEQYSDDFKEIGFAPERGNRYLYLASDLFVYSKAGGGTLIPGGASGPHSIIAADTRVAPGASAPAYIAGIPPALLAEAGVHGNCPDACSVTLIGVGNVDNDSTLDVWSVSSEARTIGGESVPAGQPYMHVNDITE